MPLFYWEDGKQVTEMDSKSLLISEYNSIIEFCEHVGLAEYGEKLKSKLDDFMSPLKVMIVGEGKSGKSTLLNALVGANIAQVDDEPKTWCINLYSNTEGEPYAELIYPGNIVKTTVERANEISERISSCADYESLSEEEKSLQEIRWYMKLKWPEKELFIIDTPGFNQIRKDTAIETISIDGVDGVKFAAKESFEKYYYKADLVLWCFEANSVGDKEVEEHLKAVYKQGKRIYGIVTKLDREENPNDRERLFLQNENRYKKYNLVTSIRSSLPTVYEDDDEEEAEEKRRVRKESIESIRRCIDYLLMDNKADEIKLESSRRYLDEVKRKIEVIEKELLEFYCDNWNIARKTMNKLISDVDKCISVPQRNIEDAATRAQVQMKSPQFLMGLWRSSGNEVTAFAKQLSREFNRSDFVVACGNEWDEYVLNIDNTVRYNLNGLKWKSITLSMDNPENKPSEVKDIMSEADGFKWDFGHKNICIDIEQVGFLYQIMQMFEKDSAIYQVINILAGDIIREKVFAIATDAITSNVNQMCEEFCDDLKNVLRTIKTEIRQFVGVLHKNHTGYMLEDSPNHIFDLEKKLLCLDLFHNDEMVYYPIVNNGQLQFEGSYYRRILNMAPSNIGCEVCVLFGQQFLKSVFDFRTASAKEKMFKTIGKYDGQSAVQGVTLEWRAYELENDSEITQKLPDMAKIDWLGKFDEVKREYTDRKEKTIALLNESWNHMCRTKENTLIKKTEMRIKTELQEEFRRFVDAWKQQLNSDIAFFLTNKQWYSLPAFSNYYEYYKQIYSKYFPQDKLIFHIWENEQKSAIADKYVKLYVIVDANGKKMTESVRKVVDMVLKSFLIELEMVKDQCLDVWTKYFLGYEASAKEICNQYLARLDELMKGDIQQSWNDYKRTTDINGKNSCKTMLEFAIRARKLPNEYIQLLSGTVPELSPYANIVRVDGTRLMESWKKDIMEKIATLSKEWE